MIKNNLSTALMLCGPWRQNIRSAPEQNNLSMTMRIALIRAKFLALKPAMDERLTRLWAGAEAQAIGEGGITIVAEATGMSRTTIRAGRDELRRGVAVTDVVRVRRAGGGRPSIEDKVPGIVDALEKLVEPVTRGDPESPLRWTSKSTRRLSAELGQQGFSISPQKVGQLLHARGYTLQGVEKPLEGASHPNRNKQFELINRRVEAFQARSAPVISVDTRKKELVGDLKSDGHEWQQDNKPMPTRVHDFIDDEPVKVIPYGVDDVAHSVGWVNINIDHDAPAFGVRAIAEWWGYMGRRAHPEAKELLIITDGGGSSGTRAQGWQTELQLLADRTGLAISVSQVPPGTRKWSRIEHRLFCHVTENWRDHPLVDRKTVVQLIGSVRTTAGLVVKAKLDPCAYPTEVADGEMEDEWNYTVHPRRERQS